MREWPLVGRAAEVEFVLDGLDAHRGVLLAGEAGVGKTRLAAEVAARARADGWHVRSLAAPGGDVPFAAFAPLLGEDTGGDGVDRFGRAARALHVDDDRVLVTLDDAHQLDDLSHAFLRHLLAATGCRVLLTARSGTPGALELADLWRSGTLDRVDVQALSRREVEELVVAVLGGPVEPALEEWVWGTSKGNPLFVRELVLDAADRGGVALVEARWRLDAPHRGPGARLLEVVADRLGAIGMGERTALDLLALSEPIGLAMLESLAGAEAVRTLEDRALVTVALDGRRAMVRVAHPLHREVLLDTLGVGAGRDLRRRLIDAVSTRGARRTTDALALAGWRCDVGDVEDWPALLAAAVELAVAYESPLLRTDARTDVEPGARRRSHLHLAIRLARAAMEAGRSVRAAGLVLYLLMRLGRRDEAAAFDAGLDALPRTDAERLRLARSRSDNALLFGTDPAPALAAVRALNGSDEPEVVVGARVVLAQLSALTGKVDEAIAVATLVVGDPAASDVYRGWAEIALAQATAAAGRPIAALDLLKDAAGLVGDDVDGLVYGRLARLDVLVDTGDLERAERSITKGLERSIAMDHADGIDFHTAALARLDLRRGRPASALARARSVVDRMAGVEVLGALHRSLVVAVHAHALLGEVAAAEACATRLDRRGGADEVRAVAALDVAQGRTSAATVGLEEAVVRARADGRVTDEIGLLHDLARLDVDVAEQLGGLASDGLLLAPVQAMARGDATAAAESFAALGCGLWEAECWALAARLLEDDGRRGSAATARSRGDEALARCEGATTPLVQRREGGDVLTPREREVAGLAARGLSDAEIAAELGRSKRTVESHLASAYAKLGVTGRSGLAAALALPG